MDSIPNGYTVSYHASRLVQLMVANGREFFIQSFHAPELGIKPNGYYRVRAEWIELPAIDILDTLDEALPLPVLEVASG